MKDSMMIRFSRQLSRVPEALPRHFWVFFAVFAVVTGALLTGRFRSYTADATILVTYKDVKTAAAADQTIETIARLHETNVFRARWNEETSAGAAVGERGIRLKRVDGSGMIRLAVSAESEDAAAAAIKHALVSLFQTVGRYYDIRTEVDVRTVSEPATKAVTNVWGWLASSALSAAAIALTVATFLEVSAKRRKTDALLEAMPEAEKPEAREETVARETNALPASTTPNLPFLEDGVTLEEYVFGKDASSTVPEATIVAKETTTVATEPTPEELKRRLNQLLKGE
jgi:hypothetical protein